MTLSQLSSSSTSSISVFFHFVNLDDKYSQIAPHLAVESVLVSDCLVISVDIVTATNIPNFAQRGALEILFFSLANAPFIPQTGTRDSVIGEPPGMFLVFMLTGEVSRFITGTNDRSHSHSHL